MDDMFSSGMKLLVIACLALATAAPTYAKDGNSGNSGSGNSGSGKDGSDDDRDDDDDDDENSGGSSGQDQDKVRDAVKSGEAVTLAVLMAYLRKYHPGRVLNVGVGRRNKTFVYQVKLLSKSGRIQTLRFNAKTLRQVGI
jgi:hypothetical protein